jgi:hypothetical protein
MVQRRITKLISVALILFDYFCPSHDSEGQYRVFVHVQRPGPARRLQWHSLALYLRPFFFIAGGNAPHACPFQLIRSVPASKQNKNIGHKSLDEPSVAENKKQNALTYPFAG